MAGRDTDVALTVTMAGYSTMGQKHGRPLVPMMLMLEHHVIPAFHLPLIESRHT